MNRIIYFASLCARAFCAVLALCSLFVFASHSTAEDAMQMITVQGLGYPPIKAENAAQAHLMAKRAAVVDAYRNALAGRTPQGPAPDVQYQELLGSVSGMTIIKEEYLKDGGIRITANVPNTAILPSAGSDMRKSDSRRSIQSVTLDEWYSIIRNLVRYDNSQNGGQYEKNH